MPTKVRAALIAHRLASLLSHPIFLILAVFALVTLLPRLELAASWDNSDLLWTVVAIMTIYFVLLVLMKWSSRHSLRTARERYSPTGPASVTTGLGWRIIDDTGLKDDRTSLSGSNGGGTFSGDGGGAGE